MDERRVRYPTGRNGDGTTHRVGLTRHCLASGAVHLPLALRDALPGGDVLALDVERDEAVVLRSEPPRRLAGLTPFFEAHDLQVNDQLELRVHDGEVRLAAVRRARRERHGEGEGRSSAVATSTWTSLDPSTWSPAERGEASGPRPEPRTGEPAADIVERIGSVTVRRLGAGRFASPPATPLARPSEPLGAEPETTGRPVPDAAAEPDAVPADEAFEALLVADPAPEAARPRLDDVPPDAPSATVREAAPDAAPEANLDAAPDAGPAAEALSAEASSAAESSDAPTGPRSAASPEVRQVGLFGHATPTPARDAPAPAAHVAPAHAAPAPEPAPSPGPTAAPRTPPVPEVREQDLAEIDARGRVRSDGRARARRQRHREEALSRAGDLRSRIVRWLHDPETPVIVPYERVQDEFDLDAQVTRDVLAGILEAPPPSLRLTLLREGMLRISRVTVEQEA